MELCITSDCHRVSKHYTVLRDIHAIKGHQYAKYATFSSPIANVWGIHVPLIDAFELYARSPQYLFISKKTPALGPFYWHGLTLITAWISNHMLSNLWDEITFPFSNFNGATVDVLKWISNFSPHFIMVMIIYSSCDWSWYKLVKGTPTQKCPKTIADAITTIRPS